MIVPVKIAPADFWRLAESVGTGVCLHLWRVTTAVFLHPETLPL